MSSGITSAVQVIATAAMSPVEGSQLSGNIDPENYSTCFDDLYGDGLVDGSGTHGLVDGLSGQFRIQTTGNGNYAKMEVGAVDNIAVRYSGLSGRSDPAMLSWRYKAPAPIAEQEGRWQLMVANENASNPTNGGSNSTIGVQIWVRKKTVTIDGVVTDYSYMVFRLLSNVTDAGIPASAVVWTDNEDVYAAGDGSGSNTEALAPEGYSYYDRFHDYTIRLQMTSAANLSASLYIDGHHVKTLEAAVPINNLAVRMHGAIEGAGFASKNALLDAVSIHQSRV